MHAIESLENFREELTSLLIRMDNRISTLSEMISFSNGSASEDKVENLNTLKLNRYKVKEMLDQTEVMNEEQWKISKERLQNEYEQNEQLLA